MAPHTLKQSPVLSRFPSIHPWQAFLHLLDMTTGAARGYVCPLCDFFPLVIQERAMCIVVDNELARRIAPFPRARQRTPRGQASTRIDHERTRCGRLCHNLPWTVRLVLANLLGNICRYYCKCPRQSYITCMQDSALGLPSLRDQKSLTSLIYASEV